ncbi:hypothetical protein [Nocardia neocaledoniensis]|uniref:hypothetical protein n=1 Tax=Nocardia neocaledoniensis TaxID=236511 RepID=UPI002458E431|nr:hypothetical protein [Nocardia neocaledoniensis]
MTGTAATPPAEPLVAATRWEVSCLPVDHAEYRRSVVMIDQRGPDSYAVIADGWVHDAEGNPAAEPRPSERSEDWLARYRHDFPTAVALAKNLARLSAWFATGIPH